MKNRFYLACFRDNVGSSVSFQCKDFKGYHTDIDKAHVCTLEEAQLEFDHAREYDLPLSADHVDALSVWKVDCQYIPKETICTDTDERYVAYEEGLWDGNDVYWMNLYSSPTTDFKRAHTMNFEQAQAFLDSTESSNFVVIPFCLADKVKRRTFDFKHVNKRIMVQGAGLITPRHIKKEAKRNKNPKTRFNCPDCGKINWQFNPYDFEVCSHC